MARKKENVRKDGRLEKVYGGKHFYGKTNDEIIDKIVAYKAKRLIGAFFEDVAEEYTKYITSQDSPVRRATRKSYCTHIKQLHKYFDGKPMKDIDAQEIRAYLESLKIQGKALKTIMNRRSALSCVFNYWCAEMHGNANPVELAGLPNGMQRGERDPPTEKQCEIINSHPDGYGFWAQFFRFTGVRLGEANALKWRDVDFENSIIVIDDAKPWDGNIPYDEDTKTKKGHRTVPILNKFRPMLEAAFEGHDLDDYVFSGCRVPLTQSKYVRRWACYCRDLGIAHYTIAKVKIARTSMRPERTVERKEWRADVTAHQFRHLYASTLFEAKIPDLVAQRLLGHADIMTTRRIYQHIRESQMGKYTDKLNAFFEEQSNDENGK